MFIQDNRLVQSTVINGVLKAEVRFSKCLEAFWAPKAIFSSSASKKRRCIRMHETSCIKRTYFHI